MSNPHSTNDITHLYEGDQSKLYSGVLSHHTDIKSEASQKQVKRIWKITLYLAVVTAVEVALGLYSHHAGTINHGILAAVFLLLTLFKAYLIVDVFMHLGDEIRNFVMAILIPLTLFAWFIAAFLSDGHFWLHMNNTRANTEQVQQK